MTPIQEYFKLKGHAQTARFCVLMLFNVAFLITKTSAQCDFQINGIVEDAETRLPVAYAMVEIKALQLATVADSTGQYTLRGLCDGQVIITCSRIGFITEELEISIPCDSLIRHKITFDPTFFSSVDIESSKYRKEAGTGISILDKENLLSKKGLSLSDQLENVPGVYGLKTGTGISKPVIHGLHSSRVLIYNNGIRHEGQQWGSEHAPEIDPNLADQISIAYGAAGLRYGHDVIGGVILVEPADIRRIPGISAELNTSGTSNGRGGMLSGELQVNFKKLKSLGFMLQGTFQQNGNIQTPHQYLDNTGNRGLNYATGINFNKSRFGLHFYYSIYNADIGIYSGSHTGNLTDLQRIIEGTNQPSTTNFSYHIGRPKQHILHELHKVRFHYVTGINSKLEILYARQYNLREEYDKHIPRNDSIAGLNKPELKLEITTHSGDVSWLIRKGSRHTLQLGVRGVYQANSYEGRFVIPNYERFSYGAFVLYEWQNKNTKIESCVRYDINDLSIYRVINQTITNKKHGTANFSFSSTLDHKINDIVQVGISAGQTWRAMQANELYSNGLHHGAASFEKGDSTLHQEISWNFLGSCRLTTSRIHVELNPYFQFIHGFTYLLPQTPPILTIRGAFPVFVYTQKDAILKGTDAMLNVKLPVEMEARLNASILRAKNANDNKFISQMPGDRYQLSLIKHFSKFKKPVKPKISIGSTYVNKQWRIADTNDYLPPPKAYVLMQAEISTGIQIKKPTLNLSFSVNNLLNKTYRDYMNRFRYFSDEAGRNFTIRITYRIENNRS